MMSVRNHLLAWAVSALLVWTWGCDDHGADIGRSGVEPLRFDSGVVVTSAWQGEWHVVVTFTDCISGATRLVEDVVDVVCPNDTLLFVGSRLFGRCQGTATDVQVLASCDYEFSDDGCNVDVHLSLELERDGDTLSGTGRWATAINAGCTSPYYVGCEELSVSGTRTSVETNLCD